MDHAEQLALLTTQHVEAARAAQGALAELSASVFNRPHLHDCFRSSAAFQRWQACHARRAELERAIATLQPDAAIALTA